MSARARIAFPFLGALALALSAWGAHASPREKPSRPVSWQALDESARAHALEEVAGRPFEERLLSLSAHFLEVPYLVSPLGEGEGPDPDPLFRADAVDCLTFVEQSLALAWSRSPAEILPNLTWLRYSDLGVGYASRLHLMEAQWLPLNVARGVLRDVTREVGGERTVRSSKVLTPRTWTSRTSRALALPADRRPLGTHALEVLPLEDARAQLGRIPAGTLLMVVREERELMPTRITHLGIVVHRGGRVWLRHAARNGYGRVVDEELGTFLKRNAAYTRWPVVGVTLFAPHERAASPATAP